jgi:predicted short-subunit dehydrogenase-like oxidoreductase (DUF2520 family)
MERIGIAGAGRLAQALGRLLHDRGQPIAAIAGRDPWRTASAAAFIHKDVLPVSYADLPSHASRILISVPDDALEDIAHILASAPQRIDVVLHTCGSRGPEALAELEARTGPARPFEPFATPEPSAEPGSVVRAKFSMDRGTACATLHPLQTITTPAQGVAALPGSSFGITPGITGSPFEMSPAADWALDIVRLLDGHALTIAPENRALYHAAAVMASNYIVATIDAAVILMGLAGVPAEPALRALGSLVRASVENSLGVGPVSALTGPIERGDVRTVAAHLRALDNAPESVRQLYRQAGLHTIGIARRKSPAIDRGKIESLLSTSS